MGPATPDFTQPLGNDANFVFSGSQWSAQVKYRPVMYISAPDYVQAYQQKFGTKDEPGQARPFRTIQPSPRPESG